MLVRTEKAAEILGLKKSTLENWRWRNKGPRFRKLGSRVLYDVHDLQLFIDAGTIETIDSFESLQKLK